MSGARDELLRVVRLSAAGADTTVLAIAGELDLYTRPVLDEAVAGCAGGLVIDLTDLAFLDSDGIHAFLRLHRQLAGVGGFLRLVYRQNQHLARLVQILGLADIFPAYNSVEAALSS